MSKQPRARDLSIRYRATTSIRGYDKNAREHSKAQQKKLKESILSFGWTAPLIIDEDGMILAGHCRYAVALELGLAEVPVVVIPDLSEREKKGYILADNRIAEQATWNKSLLRDEFKDLLELDFDLQLTGFDTLEADRILGFDDPEPSDDIVHLPDGTPPVSRVGDLWNSGAHWLCVGDARDPLVYERLLQGEKAQLILTDPPYGCAIENNVSGLGKKKHKNFVMGAGETSLPELAETILRPAFEQLAANAQAGAIAFVCTDWRACPHMLTAAEGVFAEVKNKCIWVKTNAGMGTFYRSAYEEVIVFKVSPGKHINTFGLGQGGRHRSNVWTYAGANVFRKGRMQDLAEHSTVKPKKLLVDAILDCSKPGGLVLDCFAGSGSTLVAAEITGRRGYGIELDPQYADVILRRVAEATGKESTLDGVPYSEVAKQRAAEHQEASRG